VPANVSLETKHTIKLIRELLQRESIVQSVVKKQPHNQKQQLVESLSQRQHHGEIVKLVNRLHPSDISILLEQLPAIQRNIVWQYVDKQKVGAVLLEVSDSLRQSLVNTLHSEVIVDAASHLDTDEIADLVVDLPDEIVDDVLSSLPETQRQNVRSTLAFPEDTVGAWMEFDIPTVRENVKLDAVLRYLRAKGKLPDTTGTIIVVDDHGFFSGLLSIEKLLFMSGEQQVSDVMLKDVRIFHTNDSAEDAARDFERYELIVSPVVNTHGRLVGVLRVTSMMDLLDEINQRKFLAQAGIATEENLFDPVFTSAKNRWPWIALNLLIVLIASRIIDQFDTTISSMVALAALLPITANIGGNSGNQVVALVIRGLSLKQLDSENLPHLFYKEFFVALINGVIWGGITGLLILIFYQNLKLSLVITLAMLGTMLLSAFLGVTIPLLLKKMKQDPALGSSVIVTGFVDTMGFLIFLSLAALFFN
jgi:magnesium transporter